MAWSSYKEETPAHFGSLSLLRNTEQFTIKFVLRKGLEEPESDLILVSQFQQFGFQFFSVSVSLFLTIAGGMYIHPFCFHI